MSIYSGFPTRALETLYNNYLYTTINLLQTVLLDYFRTRQILEKPIWCKAFINNLSKLSKFEKQKHLQPNFSEALKDLDTYIKSQYTFETYEKSFDKTSFSNPSAATLGAEDNYRMSTRSIRSTSFNGPRSPKTPKSRVNNYPAYAKRETSTRKSNIKNFQDRMLKNILKDLSNPIHDIVNL